MKFGTWNKRFLNRTQKNEFKTRLHENVQQH
jgi:hypothetical protein